MEKNLRTYKLIINDDDTDESGVNATALVDDPAIERTWQAFEKQHPNVNYSFQSTSPEQRIISGPLMVAGMPIFRKANEAMPEDHYVVFDGDVIRKIVFKFFRKRNTDKVNLMHSDIQPEGVHMFESFIIDSKRGIHTPEGFDKLPDGSWFGSYKVDNDELWEKFIKTNEFTGFSVEGAFDYVLNKTEMSAEQKLQQIKDILKELA